MSSKELLSSHVTEVGDHILGGDVGGYKNISMKLTTGAGDTVSPELSSGSDIDVLIPLENISASSTFDAPETGGVFKLSNLVDATINTEWLANGPGEESIGEYVDIALSGINMNIIGSVVAMVASWPNRDGKDIEVRAMTADGYDVISTFTTASGTSHSIDLSNVDTSKHTSVRLVCVGSNSSSYLGFIDIRFKCSDKIKVYAANTDDVDVLIYGNTAQVAKLNGSITSILGTNDSVKLYKLYRKGADGAPELVLQKPDGVASTFGKATLVEDLSTLASKDFVATAIENLAHSSLGGRVDTEGDLPTTDIEVGTIYLVGLDNAESFEEFIYTEEGTWDRMGSIRQSDVNLSDYTNTADFTAALGAATGTVDNNIVEMTDALGTQLGTLQTEFEEGLGSVLKESEFANSIPTEWPAHMDPNGSLYVIGSSSEDPTE